MFTRANKIESSQCWQNYGYASIFSRNNFERILKSQDLTLCKNVVVNYASDYINDMYDYLDLIRYAYEYLSSNYRNEYIIKNELLNKLIMHYGTEDVVAFNEFAVGNSIADLVLFNGKSRAYEIKTELDSPKRIHAQIEDYKRIFQECYIVVPKSQHLQYLHLYKDSTIGIIVFYKRGPHLILKEIQKAKCNTDIDSHTLIRSLRTEEYKAIVKDYYKVLPQMTAFTAFDVCEKALSNIPQKELHKLFIRTIKQRRTSTPYLSSFEYPIRQMCLNLHWTQKEYNKVMQILLTPINN